MGLICDRVTEEGESERKSTEGRKRWRRGVKEMEKRSERDGEESTVELIRLVCA